jgi:integrase
MHNPETCGTVGDLLDRYAREVIPTKSPKSRENNLNQLKMLRRVFAQVPLASVVPRTVYTYVDKRAQKKLDPQTGKVTGGRVIAHREIELLSHAYTKAVEWGFLDRHPFKNEVRLTGEKPRTRYVNDEEVIEALSLVPRRKSGSVLMIQAYLRLKLLTGISQGDLLRLQESDLIDDGIFVQRHKVKHSSGKSTIYRWTPALRAAVDLARQARPKKSTFLFCTREGKCYVNEENGQQYAWKSLWQRFMKRVLAETKVTQPFTEHDLRAKVGSDASSLEHAQALLQHADSRTTKRVYRRKAETVNPLR